MAKKFPEAEVVGIDVAPGPVDANNLPPNCRFEIDDIELGLSHYWNQFDVVHARMITTGLKDSEKAMNDIYNCLKPGGIMIWIEVDHSMFTSDTHVYHTLGSDANPNGSWVSRIIYGMWCHAVWRVIAQLKDL
jgi:trans-aconitate methyltransferase